MTFATNEEWHDCNWVGTIKKYDNTPKVIEEYENMDDYDARHCLGMKMRYVGSRFDKEEC